jgi:dipeptidase E
VRILLISNSGRPFLEWCRPIIGDFLGDAGRIAFVTGANLGDERAYWERARDALAPAPPAGLGVEVIHCDWRARLLTPLEQSDAVFIGGGNTYALLKRLKEGRLVEPIRERVHAGMPYIGSSAGSNVAGPTILTTNDWNVVALDEFTALRLVPFNINPHYLETDPAMARGSETRDERIAEYHTVNANDVLGIEERTALRIEDDVVTVVGHGRVKRFRPGEPPRWFAAGARLTP